MARYEIGTFPVGANELIGVDEVALKMIGEANRKADAERVEERPVLTVDRGWLREILRMLTAYLQADRRAASRRGDRTRAALLAYKIDWLQRGLDATLRRREANIRRLQPVFDLLIDRLREERLEASMAGEHMRAEALYREADAVYVVFDKALEEESR
jgi:hypothetical protein